MPTPASASSVRNDVEADRERNARMFDALAAAHDRLLDRVLKLEKRVTELERRDPMIQEVDLK